MERLSRSASFLTLFLCTAMSLGCSEHYSRTVVLDHQLNVSAEWATVRFPRPLEARTMWEQDLLASISSPHENSVTPFGIRMQDGTVTWPDMEIEDARGQMAAAKKQGLLRR